MDSIEVAVGTRDGRVPEYLFVFCLSSHTELLQLPSCPMLSVRVKLGHVSTPDAMTDRRLLFFCDNGLDLTLNNVHAPLMIRVYTASSIEWEDNGDPMAALLVSHFTPMPTAAGPWVRRQHNPNSTARRLLAEHDEDVLCNCTQGQYGTILWKPKETGTNQSQVQSQSDNDDESSAAGTEEDENDDDDEQELNSIIVQLKGTTFHDHQAVLKKIKALGKNMFQEPLDVQPEPKNPVDKNALLVVATLAGVRKPMGYISVQDLPRLMDAVRKGALVSLRVFSVVGKYNLAAKEVVYTCKVNIVRKGKWLSKDAN